MHNKKFHQKLIISVIAIMSLVLMTSINAAPKKDLWKRWLVNSPASTKTISTVAWQQFLDKYLVVKKSGPNLVKYAAVTKQSRHNLQQYLDYMQSIKIDDYNPKQQEAYWINLYNAATVDLILQHYPVKSIMDINISPGWFSRGPWDKKILMVEGEKVSLNDIEHRILRPIWHDPRLHALLNCASVGCPSLQPTAVSAANVNQLLTKAMREYVNSARGARVVNGKLTVSKIFVWYKEDFGTTDANEIAFLKQYANAKLKKQLQGIKVISNSDYDWNLNVA